MSRKPSEDRSAKSHAVWGTAHKVSQPFGEAPFGVNK